MSSHLESEIVQSSGKVLQQSQGPVNRDMWDWGNNWSRNGTREILLVVLHNWNHRSYAHNHKTQHKYIPLESIIVSIFGGFQSPTQMIFPRNWGIITILEFREISTKFWK